MKILRLFIGGALGVAVLNIWGWWAVPMALVIGGVLFAIAAFFMVLYEEENNGE